MKKIFLLLVFFIFSNTPSFSALMNNQMINIKLELDNLFYEASLTHKLSTKEINRIDKIKDGLDRQKKEFNSNVVPIYYKLGNIYRVLNKNDDAIDCFRTIVKYYPTSPLRKKALIYLKYYGEAIEVDGVVKMLHYKEIDITKEEIETIH